MALIKFGAKVETKDRGANALIKKMQRNRFLALRVGILAPEADIEYTGRQGPTTVGEAAFYNEFGTENAPARSWLRDWFDSRVTALQIAHTRAYQNILVHGWNERTTLQELGEDYEASVQDRILAKEVGPRNADATIAKKGFDHPLVESGILVDSITHDVTEPTT